MGIKALNKIPGIHQNKKLANDLALFDKLLAELRKKELPEDIISYINRGIDQINAVKESEKQFKRALRKTQADILAKIEKELKIVTINHYRNTWMVLGLAVFGVPIGVALGTSLRNMGFIGIGIPLGMVIGLGVGSAMDKKAFEEGRQLNLEIKF